MLTWKEQEGLPYLQWPGFSSILRHAYSSRIGGVSSAVYHSLNLGFYSKDEESLVRENWKRFLRALGLEELPLVHCRQVHGARVKKASFKGDLSSMGRCDAIWTDEKGRILAIITADCMPVFLLCKEPLFIAAVHAGWRGLASRIVSNTLKEISHSKSFDSKDIHVLAGPHIGPCCYEIGSDTFDAFEKSFASLAGIIEVGSEGETYLDLGAALKAECLSLGVPESQILISDTCTCCHEDEFFSYRRSAGKERGRMGNVIALVSDGD